MIKPMLACCLVLCPLYANSEVVASCSASNGYGFYVAKGLVKEKDAGWHEDKVTGGSFQLIRAGDDWDIIFTDSTGATLSSKGDGGRILGIVSADGDVVIHVIYEINVETYVFWLSLPQPVVTYSQAKFATRIPKHSLMTASCRKGA